MLAAGFNLWRCLELTEFKSGQAYYNLGVSYAEMHKYDKVQLRLGWSMDEPRQAVQRATSPGRLLSTTSSRCTSIHAVLRRQSPLLANTAQSRLEHCNACLSVVSALSVISDYFNSAHPEH